MGSIEEGKDADLVVYNNYPLSVYAIPDQVYIDGEIYFSRENDLLRQAKLEEEKKRLIELDKAKKGGKKPKAEDVDVLAGQVEAQSSAGEVGHE